MNCRLGDLAIVVNDFENPANNGALLKIVAHTRPGQWDIPADWNCIPLSTFRFDDKVVSPGRGVLGGIETVNCARCAMATARTRLSTGPGTAPNDRSPLPNGDSKM